MSGTMQGGGTNVSDYMARCFNLRFCNLLMQPIYHLLKHLDANNAMMCSNFDLYKFNK